MYDSDDAYTGSPPLEAMKPNYGDKPSPPPFLPFHKDDKTAGATPPHYPDIAATARNSPLEPNLKNYRQPPDFDPRSLKKPPIPRHDPPLKESLPKPKVPSESGPLAEIVKKPPHLIPDPAPPKPVQPDDEVKKEVVPTAGLQPLNDSIRRHSQDLPQLKTSPGSECESRISLPSLLSIQPPSGPCLAKSPDGNNNTQKLPSIHKALSQLADDFGPTPVNTIPSPFPFSSCPGSTTSGNDSPFDRPFPGKFPIPASPFSHFSPVSMKDASTNPSPASHSSFWRGPSHSEMLSVQTPYEDSPMTAKSPATSYPTPTEQVGAGMSDRHSLAGSTPQANGGPVGSYKCAHPGCTAAPFQTQYLLNSHANVHSQERPHFCPVEGCPRAIGGKGFKRKNEMMRHGLVHNSPGYVCPFCPDQQHKYPRPDNLQRHVRVHHVDKNKDDPILRHVLAQRPLGSARGRKRRMNNTSL